VRSSTPRASVLLVDPATNELTSPTSPTSSRTWERLARLRFPADRGVAGDVLPGTGVRVDDVAHDPRFYGGVDEHTGITTRTLLCAPLPSRQGVIGTLQVINRRGGGRFSDADLAFLEALAGAVGVAIENAQLFARVKASEEGLRAQVGAFRRDLARRDGFAEMIGNAPVMADVFRLMESAPRRRSR
jgi:Nif-specific regulatory protein